MATRWNDDVAGQACFNAVFGLVAAAALPALAVALFWFTEVLFVLRVATLLVAVGLALVALYWGPG